MTTTKMLTRFSDDHVNATKFGSWMIWLALFVATLTVGPQAQAQAPLVCDKTITADVVVFDSPTIFNRLGAQNPNWITYALRRDAIYMNRGNPSDPKNGMPLTIVGIDDPALLVGNVELRPDKRPRPLVLRSVAGACLDIKFQNFLDPQPNPNNSRPIRIQELIAQGHLDPGFNCADPNIANPILEALTLSGATGRDERFACALVNDDQVAGRCAGIHAQGVELRGAMKDDGALVGNNHPNANIDPVGVCSPNAGVSTAPVGGLVAPGGEITYELFTPAEGAFIINSYGAQIGSEASSGNTAIGMFGALNVEPKGARIYRSQVTEEELRLATTGIVKSDCAAAGKDKIFGTSDDWTAEQVKKSGVVVGVDCNAGGQPIIDYEAIYPVTIEPSVWNEEDKAGRPILNMLQGAGCDTPDWTSCELVHSDINAIIAGPDPDGSWTSVCASGTEYSPAADCPYPLESVGKNNPQLPTRIGAFREFTSQFHDEQTNSQVFPRWYNDPVLGFTLAGVKDQFMINYGSGGIGSEIIANRLHTGPMHDCTDCAYEEFFLSSSTVGDPALLVNTPANSGIEQCDPSNFGPGGNCWRDGQNLANGPIPGNYALYQEDPSNVHHSYTGDFTKVRNTHSGSFEQHIFHLHNHQWLFNPNDDNANYLDAQEIMPGSGHTYELANGGVGNRNKTSGDAIFHCHFYPHFAQGMWYHIRIMDVFETGSLLAVSTPEGGLSGHKGDAGNFHTDRWALRSGQPAPGARAHADGELPDGVPIPAIVPLPGHAMPPMPAGAKVIAVDRGNFSLLGGRTPPDPANPSPDSSQAVVDWDSVAGADGELGTADDVTPGYPFWIAGYYCGKDEYGRTADQTGKCPKGVVGQRFPTPPLDMLTEAGALDIAKPNSMWEQVSAGQAGGWNGGLPRHALLGYTSGGFSKDTQNRLDFQKVIKIAKPVYYPEIGTELERVSMRWHSVRKRPSAANMLNKVALSVDSANNEVSFVLNGSKPVPGGPYQDPCVDDTGAPLNGQDAYWFDGDGDVSSLNTMGYSDFTSKNPRTYKVANIQIDAVFNKVGYHYPQERIISLWEDVDAHVKKQRPPEPLVMRFNTFDCGRILHSNLVPHEYEIDDFQVRTPTDIIGQHIHLPKWDLTSNDGAANGWNYEDGALAPGMVVERIHAINEYNHWAEQGSVTVGELAEGALASHPLAGVVIDLSGPDDNPVPLIDSGDVGDKVTQAVRASKDPDGNPIPLYELHAEPHPFFGNGPGGTCEGDDVSPQCAMYVGARTVIQRILVDPIVNVDGVDRGLGLTFSHDHYGPSTFQQIGLYSTILAEPAGSTWRHNESGELLGTREDGGPTTWQAAILPPEAAPNNSTVQSERIPDHREFYFEMSDFQHAYEPGAYYGANEDGVPMHHDIIQPNPFDATVAVAPALENSWREAVNPPLKLKSVPFPDIVTANHLCPGPLAAVDANTGATVFETRVDPTTCTTDPNTGIETCDVFRDPTTGDPIEFAVAAPPDADGQIQATNVSPLVPRPCVEAINISHSSMWVVNYRNEPIGLRVFDPNKPGPDAPVGKDCSIAGDRTGCGAQADGMPGDLALAFQSRGDRKLPQLNTSLGDTPYPTPDYCGNNYGDGINCDRRPGDPFTPIMRAYEHDEVKIKVQVGATEEQHQTSFHGLKWLSNGSGFGRSPNSGWRNFQSHGISEQFSLQMPVLPDRNQRGSSVDYLYAQDATRDGIWTGTWGIIRTYGNKQSNLFELPENSQYGAIALVDENDFTGVCPKYAMDDQGNVLKDGKGKNAKPILAPVKHFDVFAVRANHVLPNELGITIPTLDMFDPDPEQAPTTFGKQTVGGPLDPKGGTLVYNRRQTLVPDVVSDGANHRGGQGPLNDPTALMYVRLEDLAPRFLIDPGLKEDDPSDDIQISPDDMGWHYDSDGDGYGDNTDYVGTPVTGPYYSDGIDDRCQDVKDNGDMNLALWRAGCPVKLRDNAPVEPMVLRANAGDCIEVTVFNKLSDQARTFSTRELVYTNDGKPIMDDILALKYPNGLVTAAGKPVSLDDVDYDEIPDLAGWQDLFWVVNRDMFNGDGTIKPLDQRRFDGAGNPQMHFFNNNLIAPSALAGLHAQLVEYDASQDDGVVVGNNPQAVLARPGGQHTYRYYAGHVETQFVGLKEKGKNVTREFRRIATPVEFGGTNLLSSDRIKQPQKGLYGALIIEPQGACHSDSRPEDCPNGVVPGLELVADGQGIGAATRETRAQATIVAPEGGAGSGGTYDEAISVAFRIANLRWVNGEAIKNIHQGELGREGAEDSGHAGFNYGTEPSWFRFELPPDVPFGNAGTPGSFGAIGNVHALYANSLANDETRNAVPANGDISALGDPATPVFRTTAGMPSRMHLLNGASADRDATFVLHGHVWQRDPYVCPDAKHHGLEGLCDTWKRDAYGKPAGWSIGSLALGLNPIGKYMGGEEGMGHVYGHWPILFQGGGTYGIAGDYLFRDYAPSGGRNGMYGILRVEGGAQGTGGGN